MSKKPSDIIKKYISPDDTVVLGVSGGPDSVYLLMQCLRHTNNIIVAHVNHKQRGWSSNRDEAFVKSLAEHHGLVFESITIKKPNKGNMEAFFRKARYNFFEKLRAKYSAKWILTAHHLNDNIETVLFNLTKGSFLDGLSGMTVVSEDRKILRPLLFTTKDEILTHLRKTRTPFKVDKTNEDTKFARNRIRHKVIPELRRVNNSLEQTFVANIQNLKHLQQYMNESTESWLQEHARNNHINLAAFTNLHPVMQKNVLFQLHKNLHGPGRELTQQHVNQLLKIIHQKSSNRKKEFGKSHFLQITNQAGQKVIEIKRKG